MFEHILKVVQHLQPRWLVCENVANLVHMDGGAAFRAVQQQAQHYLPGWQCKWTIYDTCKHSTVPQHRERVYIVWFRDTADADRFEFHKPESDVHHASTVLQPADSVPDKYYYEDRTNRVAQLMLENCTDDVHSTGVVYQRLRSMSVRSNKSGHVPALTASMGNGGYSGPVVRDVRGVRRFTPRECFNAQGFPAGYQTAGLKGHATLPAGRQCCVCAHREACA